MGKSRRRRDKHRSFAASLPSLRGRGVVILAEEDPLLRRQIAAILRDDNCPVVEVADGQRLFDVLASEILHPHPIDLIISNTGDDGLDVLASIRRAEWLIPILMIALPGDDDNRREARSLGADAVFGRPFDMDDFRTAVHHLKAHGGAYQRVAAGHSGLSPAPRF